MRIAFINLISALLCAGMLAPGCAKVERSGTIPADRYTLPNSELTDTLTAEQEHAADLARKVFPELSTISKHAPLEIGYSGDVFAQDVPAGWRLTFYSGWGDCPAGCINGRWYYVSVDKSGVATMAGIFKHEYDGSTNKYLDSGVALWGMPK